MAEQPQDPYELQLGSKFKVSTPEGERELDIYTREGYLHLANLWLRSAWEQKFSYEFTWLGIPIIQLPEDILLLQELVWKVRPDVVIECGVAHGGALVLYASLLELLGKGKAIGIDVEIRKYNSLAIQGHPLSHRIELIEGDSTSPQTVEAVSALVSAGDKVMVFLDSNHSKKHVASELELYSRLVTPGSYIVVFDAVMTLLTEAPSGSPEWETDNPAAAVEEFLASTPAFERDHYYERASVTYCRGGFLRRKIDTGEPPR